MKIFNSRKTKIGRHVFLATLAIASIITAPNAQQPAPVAARQSSEDRIALYQALLDLTNPWTVMCIAAHPDDEDGTSLIVMRRKYGAHTVSLFSTFGEGGQNAIGPELYEEMGAIRARETMAASEIQGSEPHFLGLKDFGYSKSADEAFKFWGHDEALRRMVLQIRKLRPDVIITNHSATSNDHGHHQATARLELEAFDAAADPKRFPDQLSNDVTVWQVQRLFVRARGNAQAQADSSPVVTIDPNERDPIRGTVFAEEALRALQKHATQGPWPKTFAEFAARFRAFTGQSAAPGQLPLIRYRLVREAKGAEALTRESHNFVDGLQLPEEVAKQLQPPTIDGRPLTDFASQSEKLIDALIAAQKSLNSPANDRTPIASRINRMRSLVNRAIASAAGLTISIAPTTPVLAQNGSVNFSFTISNNGSLAPWVIATHFDAGDYRRDSDVERSFEVVDLRPYQIGPVKTFSWKKTYHVPRDAPITSPHSEHLYDGRLFTQMASMHVSLKVKGVEVGLRASTWYDVAPSVEIADISPSPLVITSKTPVGSQALRIRLTNHQATTATGKVGVMTTLYPGAKFDKGPPFSLKANETRTIDLSIGGSLGLQRNGEKRTKPSIAGTIPLSILLFNGTDRSSNPARSVQAVIADAQVQPNLRVGYIRGFDFSLPNALAALGVESKELGVDEVKTADLSKYTSIIVDNRVYESQPDLIAANQKLLDYANAGGTLIVFYHKSDEWNPDPRRNRPQLAPYKLLLGNERITDETAPITFIEPAHPLLNVPNKLNQDDFKDWIQERGLYYPKEWDPQFHALLQSNDPGEAPLKGGLLVADYGRGHYIYTSMVWYRELRAGVPGAYRMLANMISYGQAEGKSKK